MKQNILETLQLEKECNRCLGCEASPCARACPLHVSPKDFIALAKQHLYSSAVKAIYDKNPLGLICGLICPDNFCMKNCVRRQVDSAINIPSVQASVIQQTQNYDSPREQKEFNSRKVAVIGAGPAGIGAAWKLLELGFHVEMFEKDNKIGGSLNLIPKERLPHHAIQRDFNPFLLNDGLKIHFNTPVSAPETLLEKGFWGVVVAIGTQNTNHLGIEGEEHVVSYVDYLSHFQNYKTAQKIAVIGGGKVAADCALVAHRQGAKSIQILIRRHLEHMKMAENEKQKLLSYGVETIPLTRVVKIEKHSDSFLCYLSQTRLVDNKCIDNPNIPVRTEKYDLVIKAIGGKPLDAPEQSHLFYSGECKNGASTVVEAVASGIEAALKLNSAGPR